MLNSQLENSELAQICREIVELGDEPHDFLRLRRELPKQINEWWTKNRIELTRRGEDPLERYHKEWIWCGVKDEVPPIREYNEFSKEGPDIDRYWRSVLAVINQSDETLSDYEMYDFVGRFY